MREYCYCVLYRHIISNPLTKACPITEQDGIECIDCRYHQLRIESQLPQRYSFRKYRLDHIRQFAIPEWMKI